MKAQALDYFSAFSNKDIAKLRAILAADVVLRDWQVDLQGLENVISEMKSAFSTFPDLQVSPELILGEGNIVMAQLLITLDASIVIKVVDVLEFESTGLLKSIIAYKG